MKYLIGEHPVDNATKICSKTTFHPTVLIMPHLISEILIK